VEKGDVLVAVNGEAMSGMRPRDVGVFLRAADPPLELVFRTHDGRVREIPDMFSPKLPRGERPGGEESKGPRGGREGGGEVSLG
jgi:hypothetical protein